jgi:nucleoside-diphosphate-sugar epimerase
MIERELLGTDTITRELEGRISIPQETVDFWADTNDIKTKLGWKPAVSLSAGIKKTIQVLK